MLTNLIVQNYALLDEVNIKFSPGLNILTGETGSGKSMSLFSALQEIASPAINIQTAEDPIEYTLAGVNQVSLAHVVAR